MYIQPIGLFLYSQNKGLPVFHVGFFLEKIAKELKKT